jgi:hypothetical protein
LHTKAGLPDFSWYGIPKREKYTKITTKYTKWQSNIPNGHKTYQHLFLQDTPKNCPYWDFWFEKNNLATLHSWRQKTFISSKKAFITSSKLFKGLFTRNKISCTTW